MPETGNETIKTEEEIKAEEAKIKLEEEARVKAELEAKVKADAEAEAKVKSEIEAKAKLDAEAKIKAEADAKAKAEQSNAEQSINVNSRDYEYACVGCKSKSSSLEDFIEHNKSCGSIGFKKNLLVKTKKSLSLNKNKINSNPKLAVPNEKELTSTDADKKNTATIGKALDPNKQ